MNTNELYNEWLEKADYDPDLIKELEKIKGNESEISDRFYRCLEFGTAGLRGVIGAGTNRMNYYTVCQATQGLSDFLNKNFKNPSIAIGYDSRIKSEYFAKEAAKVLAANGIKVYLYDELEPTPCLSYAIRKFKTSSGIILTASHNPGKYNGYKCYDSNGYQMTDEAAAETYEFIQKVDYFTGIKTTDFDKAVEFLREKGLATAQKKAGRIAAEGIVATTIKGDNKVAAIVEVNAETDFVAKNEVFQTYVKEVVEQAADTAAADIEAFKAEPWALDTSMTVQDKLAAMIAKIGENMNIRRFEKIVSEDGIVVSYIHAGGKIGVLVEAQTDNNSDTVKEALKNVAMQIAALNPKYVSTDEVPEDYKEHEKEILMAQAKNDPKNANKPENIIEQMISGRLNKELKEVCLLEQEYVKAENKETVAKYLEAVSKEVGSEVTLKRFIRFETGEGLEKKNEDFAAEVAAQMNQ